MKLLRFTLVFTALLFLLIPPPLPAQESQPDKAADKEQVQELEDMVVEEKAGAPGYTPAPSQTTIELEDITFIGQPNSVIDVFKTQAMVDFRGQSDLDPGVDSVYLNGFSSKHFVTAMDGVTILKSGGRKSSNIVDWAQLPTFLLESVEVLPGPHSALYDAKAIGGVINMKTKAPKARDTRVPELSFTTGYSSYNTFTNTAVISGAVDKFTYDLAYRNYRTDGYLRNTETEINTGFGRLGLLLPNDGYITFSASTSDLQRNAAVNNPGLNQDKTATDVDGSYPEVTNATWDPWQNPTWDTKGTVYRANYAQTLGINKIEAGAYYGKDSRERAYMQLINKKNPALGSEYYSWETKWWQRGGKVKDAIQWADNQTTTIGCDLAQLFDVGAENTKTERVRKAGAFIQHEWGISPSLDLTMGLRYEDVNIWVSNWTGTAYHNSTYGKYVEREFDGILPKTFTTWKMDHIAPWLRDTSLSLGISRIWHAPDYHGDYNPQGRPAGIFLDEEHGMGYDLVLNRRLCRDINLKLGYSFYQIKDFIAYNRTFAKYSDPKNPPADPALMYSDYRINLDEVHRHGINLELGGHLTDELSFYATWAWQRFFNQGDEPAGETELDQRAEHLAAAGLRYALNDKTTLMLDYSFQSDEVTEQSNQISQYVWEFNQVEIPAHSVVDLGVRYQCFEKAGWLRDGVLNLYIKNLMDEDYYDTSAYPATDRTFGFSFSIKI
ncbi:MAG: TonB-dependent receptor [Desulfobacter sp.]|nr:MAG: TonB-dependent receptor [Desulfobacter sp.]